MKKTIYALPFIIAVALMFFGLAAHFGTEGFESEIYNLRICESDSCHLRPQFNDMKAVVKFMRACNATPMIELLIPDRWDSIEVLPKMKWVAELKKELRLKQEIERKLRKYGAVDSSTNMEGENE